MRKLWTLSICFHPLCQQSSLSIHFHSYWLSGEEGEIEIWHLAARKRRVLFDESATGYDITPPRLYRFARSHRQQLSSSGVNEYGHSVSGYKERSMALAAQIQKWTLDIVTKWCFSRTQTSFPEFVQHFHITDHLYIKRWFKKRMHKAW